MPIRYQAPQALLAVSLCALCTVASAADRPATVDGAKKLGEVFATYFGKAASAPPNLTIAAGADHYDVAFDYGAAMSALAGTVPGAATYAPAIMKFKLAEQDDGAWRVGMDGYPSIKGHVSDKTTVMDMNLDMAGFKQELVFDPATGWIRTGRATADSMTMKVAATGIDESFGTGRLVFDQVGKATDGVASLTGTGGMTNFNFGFVVRPDELKKASGEAAGGGDPINVTGKSDKATIDIALQGLKAKQGLDLWAFAVAHPGRAQLAANEPAFKALLTAFLTNDFHLSEGGTMQKLVVTAPQGPFTLENAKFGVVAGVSAKDNLEEHFAGDGFVLPPGLVPPQFADLTPKSFDIGFKVSGFDAFAAGKEAIADLHLAGDGNPISDDDGKKILAKGMSGGPIVIDLPASHIVAPKLDIAYDGQIKIDGVKRYGKVNVHVKNFDQTVEALKALGPLVPAGAMSGVAMVKGLAKKDADGALTWVAEITADGSITVNGLPMGKAPI